MADKEKKGQVPRRTLLDETKKQEMMAVLLRNEEAFESVKSVFTVYHARYMGDGIGLLWKLAWDYHERHGHLPAQSSLRAELRTAVKEDPSVGSEDELDDAQQFIEYAFDDEEHGDDLSKSKKHCGVAVETARAFINEVHSVTLSKSLYRDGTIPVDLIEVLNKEKTSLEIASSISAAYIDKPFPDGWDSEAIAPRIPTGCAPLDDFMGGGWCAGEVIIFIGPTGSCKTSMVCHSVSESVRALYGAHQKKIDEWKKKRKKNPELRKPKRPVVVLIFTEGDMRTYRLRILAHMAQVPWSKLMQMESIASLSSAKKCAAEPFVNKNKVGTEYEKYEFTAAHETNLIFRNEQQRVRHYVPICNQHLVLIDCSNSKDTSKQIGKGGFPEIGSVLKSYFRKHKNCYPVSFWVDHISALADRISEHKDLDSRGYNMLLKRMPLQAQELAREWNVPIALMHQLAGAATGRGATARYHHSDAEGCKSIAQYADFVITTGPTDDNGYCVWDATKHRREKPMPRKVIYVQGEFQRVVDRDDLTVVHGSREIVEKDKQTAYQAQKHKGGGAVKPPENYTMKT